MIFLKTGSTWTLFSTYMSILKLVIFSFDIEKNFVGDYKNKQELEMELSIKIIKMRFS